MKTHLKWFFSLMPAIFMAAILGVNIAHSAGENDMKGWGVDDPYNRLYDVREYEKLRAWVVGFKEEAPMEGMSPATILIVRDGDEQIDVQICPTWFAKPRDIGVKKGDRVKIKGVWAEVNGQDVFMAAKIKKGDYYEFKVRLTKSGKPFWTMTPEELAKERAPANQ